MDPMEQAEAEMLRKEEDNRRDLESAIGLENFMDRRDYSDRGALIVMVMLSACKLFFQ